MQSHLSAADWLFCSFLVIVCGEMGLRMKIGILGGTFNPIHTSHVQMAKECFDMLSLDKLIVIPTFIPPHKSAKHLLDANDRLIMCGLAIKDCPGFEVCDYEIMEQGRSYTYRTLKFLRDKHPGSEFFLLMGADMFLTVQDWRHPQEIYRMATLCAAQREHGEFKALEFHAMRLRNEGAACIILNVDPTPLSSTLVRDKIMEGEDVTGMLDPAVWQYIKENRLYGA